MQTRYRALRALTQPSQLPLHPPAGPSCSRWFSCSCCCNKPSSSLRLSDPAINPVVLTRHRGYLPPPPSLPYSPDSIPFQRQLAALRDCVSDPRLVEQAWTSFHDIHVDSRRYVPNDVFLELLQQQLQYAPLQPGDSSEGRRLGRALWLVEYGLQCGMTVDDIGHQTIGRVLILAGRRAGMETASWVTRHIPIFRQLWRGIRKETDPSDLPHKVRVAWLSILLRHAELSGTDEHGWNIFRHFIQRCGPLGAEVQARKVLSRRTDLDRVIWCLKHDLTLDGHIFVRAIENADQAGKDLEAVKFDPDPRLGLLRDAYEGQPMRMPAFKHKSERDHVTDWVIDPTRIDDALALFAKELTETAPDAEEFVRNVVLNVENARDVARRSDLVIGIAQHLVSSRLLPDFKENIAGRLLPLVIEQIPSAPAFVISEILYSIARAHHYRHRWTNSKADKRAFRALCEYAYTPPYQHLGFISRLLADRRTDGNVQNTSEVLDIVRAILRSTDPYRFVLLERHMREYFAMTSRASPDEFVNLVAQNLRLSEDPERVLARVVIVLRQLVERDILPRIGEVLVRLLIENDETDGPSRAIEVIDFLQYDIGLAPLYFRVIQLLISRRDLPGAVDVYRRMLRRQIVPETRTIEVLIEGFAQAGYRSEATEMALAAIRSGAELRSQVIGRLMLRLDRAGRIDDAQRLENAWKGTANAWRDNGLRAAKLFMRNSAVASDENNNMLAPKPGRAYDTMVQFVKKLDKEYPSEDSKGADVGRDTKAFEGQVESGNEQDRKEEVVAGGEINSTHGQAVDDVRGERS
ncbi:hypothetical protein BCR39DRAFT_547214 [Naematelia encephala]|uniref:Pentatricopeptide repeat domain-containing protein n=1 Tax=Naematelia encephala TaxID=71784 RepID=A0A1Y2AQQ6_9TREE|nr:hypothetical protein BCR39DRAFT_547214 [Naematelia encephala]